MERIKLIAQLLEIYFTAKQKRRIEFYLIESVSFDSLKLLAIKQFWLSLKRTLTSLLHSPSFYHGYHLRHWEYNAKGILFIEHQQNKRRYFSRHANDPHVLYVYTNNENYQRIASFIYPLSSHFYKEHLILVISPWACVCSFVTFRKT